MCKLTEFVILFFSEIFYSEKPILKVSIIMTGMIDIYRLPSSKAHRSKDF